MCLAENLLFLLFSQWQAVSLSKAHEQVSNCSIDLYCRSCCLAPFKKDLHCHNFFAAAAILEVSRWSWRGVLHHLPTEMLRTKNLWVLIPAFTFIYHLYIPALCTSSSPFTTLACSMDPGRPATSRGIQREREGGAVIMTVSYRKKVVAGRTVIL